MLSFRAYMSDSISTDFPETPSSVTIGALGYRARCTEAGCGNLARLGLRYADAGGRPMTNLVFCHHHGWLRVERERSTGLKVYDDRHSP
jgi:hypothetical protein